MTKTREEIEKEIEGLEKMLQGFEIQIKPLSKGSAERSALEKDADNAEHKILALRRELKEVECS